MDTRHNDAALRRAVRTVALLNLAYFGVEFAIALAIGSVSLFADSIDFLEDTAVNGLILMALNWAPSDVHWSEWPLPLFC
jgi:Co/Zn/Cd efflux system component